MTDTPAPGSSPLLVTGLPRSGTSWAGKMLEASGDAVYINEPLNPRHPPGRSPGVLDAEVTHAFQYICADNGAGWSRPFADTAALRYHPRRELGRNRGAYDLARMVKYGTAFAAGRLRGRRALLDDPYAVLSAAWFARELGCRAAVLVRDPVAVVASWRRLGWTAPLDQLLDQPLLVRDLPDRLAADLRALSGSHDHIAAISLLWRLTYTLIDELRAQIPAIRVFRYEDLVTDPLDAFPAVYAHLGLTCNARALRGLRAATARRDPPDAGRTRRSRRAHRWNLRGGLSRTAYRPGRPAGALTSYRDRLAPRDIARIRALTADVAALFYPECGKHGAGTGG